MTAPLRLDRALEARRSAVGPWERAPDGGYFVLRGLDLLVPILRAASGIYIVGFGHPRLLAGGLVAFAVGEGDDVGFDIGALALHPAVEDMAAAGLLCATWATAPAALRPGAVAFLSRELDPVIFPARAPGAPATAFPVPIPERFGRARRPSARVVPGPAAWATQPAGARATPPPKAAGHPARAAAVPPSDRRGGLFRWLLPRRAGAA